jgi:hypothetical protein
MEMAKKLTVFSNGMVNDLIKMNISIPQVIKLIKLNNSGKFYRSDYAAKLFVELLDKKLEEYDKSNKLDPYVHQTKKEYNQELAKRSIQNLEDKVNKRLEDMRINEMVRNKLEDELKDKKIIKKEYNNFNHRETQKVIEKSLEPAEKSDLLAKKLIKESKQQYGEFKRKPNKIVKIPNQNNKIFLNEKANKTLQLNQSISKTKQKLDETFKEFDKKFSELNNDKFSEINKEANVESEVEEEKEIIKELNQNKNVNNDKYKCNIGPNLGRKSKTNLDI